ncbi:hypothetical protein PDESU_03296 [Pontiella desulfatans]|uniref:Uncharacterized protein n=1 Tax=Pontiella desulfatans TaxID=2750659 RepID=A0A6C2U4I3_PONDE|nr:hypothetical protein [Pontiella desulfatans]VGO14727.1 hypothetical protein PDESU_03296 [Pontiella desulfatans]
MDSAKHIHEMVAEADRRTELVANTEEHGMIENTIRVTLSKIMAFVVVGMAFGLDLAIMFKAGSEVFEAKTFLGSLITVTVLVTGKQALDTIRQKIDKGGA